MSGRHETPPPHPLGAKSAARGERGALERPKLLTVVVQVRDKHSPDFLPFKIFNIRRRP